MRKKMRVYTAAKIAADQGHEPQAILAAVADALMASATDADEEDHNLTAADPRYQIACRLSNLLDELRDGGAGGLIPTVVQAAAAVRVNANVCRFDALEAGRKGSLILQGSYARVAEDLDSVALDLENGDVKLAEANARRLDTAVRDRIPAEVCRLFGWEILS